MFSFSLIKQGKLLSSVIVLLKGRYCFRAIFYALYTVILPVSTIFYDGKHLGQKKKVTKNCEKKKIKLIDVEKLYNLPHKSPLLPHNLP